MDQLRSLRVFVRVIDEGSFAGAARALDLAPAVVTRAVAELEEHLGARLLQRTTRRMALTETGETYLEHARRILLELDEADAAASTASTVPAGMLRVVVPPAFAVHQLAKHLPAFRDRCPQVSLELAAPGPVDAVDDTADVSILSVAQQPLQGDFVARPLACSHFIACAAPAYLARRGRPKQPAEIAQHDGVLPAVKSVRHELTLFRTDGTTRTATIPAPTPALSTSHIDTIFAAAIAGLGIAALPSFVVEDALRAGALERVLPDWRGLTLTLYAAMPTRKHVPARTRAFVDFLLETFGGKPEDPWLTSIH